MFAFQVGAGTWCGGKQEIRDDIDDAAIHLFRPRPGDVAGTQARFDVPHRNAVMEGSDCSGHRRGGITVDQHAIGSHLRIQRIQALEQLGAQAVEGLVGNHHIKIVIGGDLEQRHHLVQHRPMLACGADDGFDIRRLTQRLYQRPHLDCFRTGTENRKNLHRRTPSRPANILYADRKRSREVRPRKCDTHHKDA
ncbi:hypothetical protein D3C71_1621950 [compost metagenome]